MTTVSLVECKTPTSLRTCGSSVNSLAFNRKRLQCFSPEKRAAALKASSPNMRERCVSVSPAQFGVEGSLLSSPLNSPRPLSTYNDYRQKWAHEESSHSRSSSSSDISDIEFSDEDLDYHIKDQENSTIPLRVVGSRPKLHGMYHVPNIQHVTPKTSQVVNKPREESQWTTAADIEQERQCNTSPDNPPPSPIYFRPSLEGFVIGGQKLARPDRTPSNKSFSYSSRDFVPGFVKQPLYQCGKCEGKVVEEEQSQVALQRRLSFFMTNRASTHRLQSEVISLQSVGSHIDQEPSQRFLCSSSFDINSAPGSSPSSPFENKSFIQIYSEKKKQKEEQDNKMKEEKAKRRDERKLREMRERIKKSENGDFQNRKKSIVANECEFIQTIGVKKIVRTGKDNKEVEPLQRPSKTPSDANDLMWQPISPDDCETLGNISDLSKVQTFVTTDRDNLPKSATLPQKADYTLTSKCQVRRCWSSIWPFMDNPVAESIKRTDSEKAEDSFGQARCRSKITPFYPLPTQTCDSAQMFNIQSSPELLSPSCESLISSISHKVFSLTEVDNELTTPEADIMANTSVLDNDNTMTATVIVPQRDRPCTQWITFNGDNEPVLNDAPEPDNGCDTFLKRLQRSKLYNNTDPGLPSGQQFCFEAMVDKRYNRWKRRRRKKKNAEFQRSTLLPPPSSDSSDENDDGDRQLERIIDRMYDKINGPAPQTPNGTRDTPRFRNRRRRKEIISADPVNGEESPIELTSSSYDASSEWTLSDKDGGLQSSSSGVQYLDLTVTKPPEKSTSGTFSDDLCTWPYLEQYKQEIMKRIQNTPPEEIDDMDQKDWLPEIIKHQGGATTRISNSPDSDVKSGCQTPTDQQQTVKERSDSYSTNISPNERRPKKFSKTKNTSDPGNNSYSYVKWSRSQKPTPKKPYNDDKLPSPTGTTNWSEMNIKPTQAKSVGVVAIGEADIDSSFRASVRPIKRNDPTTKLPKKVPRESSQIKRQNINLPALSKNQKSQTLPSISRRNSISKPDKGAKGTTRATNFKDTIPRPKTQPQTKRSGRRGDPIYGSQVSVDFRFRDYYLRSLYNNKQRVNSHVDSYSQGGKLKRTITVDTLDLSSRKPKKKPDEAKLTDLSFTRSFTFSMFDLPEMYKLYNNNIERRANGEENTGSDS